MDDKELKEYGYIRYDGGKIRHNCDEYFSKTIKDDIGKKYQIVFYKYDWGKYPNFLGHSPISYMPEIYFCIDEELDINVFHTFAGFNDSIKYVEEYAEKTWNALNFQYIERF